MEVNCLNKSESCESCDLKLSLGAGTRPFSRHRVSREWTWLEYNLGKDRNQMRSPGKTLYYLPDWAQARVKSFVNMTRTSLYILLQHRNTCTP